MSNVRRSVQRGVGAQIASKRARAQKERLATMSLGSVCHVPLVCGGRAARRNAGEQICSIFYGTILFIALASASPKTTFSVPLVETFDIYIEIVIFYRCDEEGTELCGHTDGRCFCKGNRSHIR